MAQRDGDRVVGAGVRRRGREVGPAEELVQVGAADAYVRRCDLGNFLVCVYTWYVCVGEKAYSDFSRAAFGLSHIALNPDILFAIVSCCAHVCPVTLSLVPALKDVSWSLSVVITLLMNAHSIMAAIRLLYTVF